MQSDKRGQSGKGGQGGTNGGQGNNKKAIPRGPDPGVSGSGPAVYDGGDRELLPPTISNAGRRIIEEEDNESDAAQRLLDDIDRKILLYREHIAKKKHSQNTSSKSSTSRSSSKNENDRGSEILEGLEQGVAELKILAQSLQNADQTAPLPPLPLWAQQSCYVHVDNISKDFDSEQVSDWIRAQKLDPFVPDPVTLSGSNSWGAGFYSASIRFASPSDARTALFTLLSSDLGGKGIKIDAKILPEPLVVPIIPASKIQHDFQKERASQKVRPSASATSPPSSNISDSARCALNIERIDGRYKLSDARVRIGKIAGMPKAQSADVKYYMVGQTDSSAVKYIKATIKFDTQVEAETAKSKIRNGTTWGGNELIRYNLVNLTG